MKTIECSGETYAVCNTQSEIDAISGPEAMIAIDNPGLRACITQAKSVRVLRAYSIDARDAKIGYSIYASNAEIGDSIYASGAKIGDGIYASNAEIGYSIDASGAKIGDGIYASNAEIGYSIHASGAKIGDSIDASGAEIGGSIDARDAKIGDGIYASNAEIGYSIDASGAKIGDGIYASGAKIGDVKIGKPTPAEIEIFRTILANIDRLEMNTWHGEGWNHDNDETDCKTTHCMAGFAQCCGDAKVRRMDTLDAGRLMIPSASHLFFAPNPVVEKWLREQVENAAAGKAVGK